MVCHPAHVEMRVRFTGKFNAAYGLVQEQKATIVDFVFHEDDARRCRETGPGQFINPQYTREFAALRSSIMLLLTIYRFSSSSV